MVGALLGAAGAIALRDDAPSVSARVADTPSEVDIGFSQDMVVHHQQAVDMVRALGERGGAWVRSVAAAIETAQLGEIGMMSGWLALWHAPPVRSGPPMAWMADHDHTGEMPGMATSTDLDKFSELSGSASARHFLDLMIRHHEGALEMASYAGAHAGTDVVRAAAARMLVEQRQEISLMRQLLALA